jgi:hypothetical protein
MAMRICKWAVVLAFGGISTVALGANVGYYDMSAGSGQAYMVPPITATGNTPVSMSTLSPAELAGVKALFVTNPSNGGYGATWVAQLPAVTAAVNAGMSVVVFDRTVTGANANMPGMAGVTTVRDFADDANIEPVPGNVVVNGPFGVIGPTTLDGGNSSSHGYSTLASLPGGAVPMLTRTAANEIVMFGFKLGAGQVIYSTVPLDFYLTGGGNDPPRTAMNTILAPNSIVAAVNGIGGGISQAVPTLSEWAMIALALLVAALGGLALRFRARTVH